MPLNKFKQSLKKLPFKWPQEGIKYLGNILNPDFGVSVSKNLASILVKIKEDLDRWKYITLSLWGKIDTIKMNVLPRLIYVIMAFPLLSDKSYFKKINSLLASFIWNGKRETVQISSVLP